jgi:glycine cleavage system transcriptional repressor
VLREPAAPTQWQNAPVTYLAITVLGHDRPGIIAQAAEALAGCGMNLEDSSMTLLRGHFAMTLICAGTATVAEIETALAPLADGSLTVDVRELPRDAERRSAPGSTHLVTVHGADRLGIVARLAGVVAAAGGNITDLTTRLTGELYVLLAEVDLTPEAAATLEADLAAAAAELGVGVTLRPLERDEL